MGAEGDLEILPDDAASMTDAVIVDDLSGDPTDCVPIEGLTDAEDADAPQQEIGRIKLQTVKVASPVAGDDLTEDLPVDAPNEADETADLFDHSSQADLSGPSEEEV